MCELPFDNIALRVRGKRLALSSGLPPFRAAYWREADVLAAQLGLADLPLEALGASHAVQARFLDLLSGSIQEGGAFRPAQIGYSAPAAELRRREEFRSRYRLVKLLGKCSREPCAGRLTARTGAPETFGSWLFRS